MNVKELRALYRTHIDDSAANYFYTDEIFLTFLNEAVDEACIRANLIFDKTSSFCTIPVIGGQSVYSIDPAIYRIDYASITDANGTVAPLFITDYLSLDQDYPLWRTELTESKYLVHNDTNIEIVQPPVKQSVITAGSFIAGKTYEIAAVGTTDFTAIGASSNAIGVVFVATGVGSGDGTAYPCSVLNIECYRLPLTALAADTDSPSIAIMHHRALVYWALNRSYSQPDSPMYNLQAANIWELKFDRVFGKRPMATTRRKQMANRPHRNRATFI